MSEQTYTMPVPELGEMVWWYPDGDSNQPPHPAIVSKAGGDTICVNIVETNSHNLMLRDGCRHVSDPRRKVAELRENGVWEFSPWGKRLREMDRVVRQLEGSSVAKK